MDFFNGTALRFCDVGSYASAANEYKSTVFGVYLRETHRSVQVVLGVGRFVFRVADIKKEAGFPDLLVNC